LQQSGEVPVIDVDRFVLQGRDKVLEVVQRYSRLNSIRSIEQRRIVLEQIALRDERDNSNLMAALGVHQLDQRHPGNETNPVAIVAYKSQTGHNLKPLRIS
jgi:hypothetical protein